MITGGAGFVGVNLIAALRAAGRTDAVTVLDDESLGDRRHLVDYEHRFVEGDIRVEADLDRALEGADAVVHLAADTRVMDSIEDPVHNFDVNIGGTIKLLEACRRHGVSRVIAASTGGAILGEVPPPVHEGMVARPSSPYGASKLAMEGYLSAYSDSYGVSGCALRFSNIYGPRSYHKGSVVAHFFKEMLAGRPLVVYGDGSQARDFLYVDDLTDGILAAVEGDATGPHQLGSGRPTTVNELIGIMREVTGRDVEVRYEPARAGEIHRTWCDIARARDAFGFDPRTELRDGIARSWDWFRERRA